MTAEHRQTDTIPSVPKKETFKVDVDYFDRQRNSNKMIYSVCLTPDNELALDSLKPAQRERILTISRLGNSIALHQNKMDNRIPTFLGFPKLDEGGKPKLDKDGNPLFEFRQVTEGVIEAWRKMAESMIQEVEAVPSMSELAKDVYNMAINQYEGSAQIEKARLNQLWLRSPESWE